MKLETKVKHVYLQIQDWELNDGIERAFQAELNKINNDDRRDILSLSHTLVRDSGGVKAYSVIIVYTEKPFVPPMGDWPMA